MTDCSSLSCGAKLTTIEDVLCVGTMGERGHKTLLNLNQTKISQNFDLLFTLQGAFRVV